MCKQRIGGAEPSDWFKSVLRGLTFLFSFKQEFAISAAQAKDKVLVRNKSLAYMLVDTCMSKDYELRS